MRWHTERLAGSQGSTRQPCRCVAIERAISQPCRDELEEIKTSTINETKTLQADTKAQEEADLTNFQARKWLAIAGR